jgi:hypothetical protein
MDPFWGLVFGGKWGPKTKMSTCLSHRIREYSEMFEPMDGRDISIGWWYPYPSEK